MQRLPVPAVTGVRRAAALVLCLLVAGCAGVRADVARPDSVAIHDPGTRLARAFAEPLAARPGMSGVAILEDGPLAWLSRVALTDAAERSIDVQYYIYDDDETGLVLLQRLRVAAERGVRVRLLIDDNNLVGRDLQLAQLAGHRNIEVRVFNPFRFRSRWTRPLQYVLDLPRANRRMHNKIFAVDGAVAIVGGRNIGGNYFNFDEERPNFHDVDLLVVGPAARELASAFDLYWNSEWAFPAEALVDRLPTPAESARLHAALDAYARQSDAYPRRYAAAKQDYLDSLLVAHRDLDWARVDVVVDEPDKVEQRRRPDSAVGRRLNEEWRKAREELLVESAYFVPRRTTLGLFAEARERGVAVAVLTNSLSATDVSLVHAGYQKRRRALLDLGVELYEFRRDAGPKGTPVRGVRDRHAILDGRASEASLHSKVMVVDRRVAYVGSFNLDPRSRRLNTEIGLFVYSGRVAERLAALFFVNAEPTRSWKVEFDRPGSRRLVWVGARDGATVRESREPDTTWPLRALVHAAAFVPGLDGFL